MIFFFDLEHTRRASIRDGKYDEKVKNRLVKTFSLD
jgi:hypothetical protein